MFIEIGHFSLVLALVVAIAQMAVPLWGAWRGQRQAMAFADSAAMVQFGLIVIAFAALMHSFITSDFSVLNVYQNSHTDKPMLYKIAGVWGNHEGSLLLWLIMLSGMGAAVALFGQHLPLSLRARVLGIQALIGVCFIAFSLYTSNPFLRLMPPPINGTDLNPLLQDPGLAFHPPFLYFGYVGFSVAFSFGVAALLEGKVDPAWARWVRPWTLVAWSSLTLGIAMGSWWAYYELGWGGYWFWDPVENASLMPWLAGTALLHSAIVVEKRDTLKLWTILMAIAAFSTSLLGTFVVRSGLLTSVHAFASDPERGAIMLGLFFFLTGGALVLFALRGGAMRPTGTFKVVSRESALILNNVMLCVILVVVVGGTFAPMFAQLLDGAAMSVGTPYYTITTTPLMLLLALFMIVGTVLPWKRGKMEAVVDKLKWAGLATVVLSLLWSYSQGQTNILSVVGLMMGLWIIFGTLVDIASRVKLMKVPMAETARRARGLPGAAWGGAFAHAGVGVVILGMVGTSLWVGEEIEVMSPGDVVEIAGYELRYDFIEQKNVANYQTEMAHFTLLRNGKVLGKLDPEKRYYPVADQGTVEAAIIPRWFSDVYVALGEERAGTGPDARVVRVWYHPLVMWIWGGSLLMTLGGLVSLSDRRYRIGAPMPKAKPLRPKANKEEASAI